MIVLFVHGFNNTVATGIATTQSIRLGLGVAADDDAVLSLSTLRILCRLETQSWDDAEASFRLASKWMSGDERRAYWREITSAGLDAVRESAGFRRLDRMFQAPKEDVK